MNLSYENDLLREGRQRDDFRQLLLTLCWGFSEESALGRLSDRDGEVPATDVLKELPKLHRWAGMCTDEWDKKYANDEVIGRFKAYVRQQVRLEAVAAKADRLVAAAVKAGLGYGPAQSMFVRALDRYNETHPNAFAVEGW